MKRFFQFITAGVLLLTASGAMGFGNQTCKPVDGHFEANLVPPGEGHCPPDPTAFCTAGRVWGGIQGDYQFVMTGAFPSVLICGVPTILFFTGQRSEEHTSELQSRPHLLCRLLLDEHDLSHL